MDFCVSNSQLKIDDYTKGQSTYFFTYLQQFRQTLSGFLSYTQYNEDEWDLIMCITKVKQSLP